MWVLAWAIYMSGTVYGGNSVAVASQTMTGFTSKQSCEDAGQRVLELSRGYQRHQQDNVIYTCVKVE